MVTMKILQCAGSAIGGGRELWICNMLRADSSFTSHKPHLGIKELLCVHSKERRTCNRGVFRKSKAGSQGLSLQSFEQLDVGLQNMLKGTETTIEGHHIALCTAVVKIQRSIHL